MNCSPLAVIENISSVDAIAMVLCIVIVFCSVLFDLLLLSRIGEFKADSSDENFLAAKKMQTAAGFCSGLSFLWISTAVEFLRPNGILVFGIVLCISGIIFNFICLQKYNHIKSVHNADIMKRAKGDPSVILSEDIELSNEEKAIVSQIALSAGVRPDGDYRYKSDEELFGDARDPNASLEGNEDSKDNGENANLICPFCGKTNKSEYKICAYCGQLLPVPDEAAADQ